MLHPLSLSRTRVYRPLDPSPERQAQDEAGLVPHFHGDVVREPPLPPGKHEAPSKGEDHRGKGSPRAKGEKETRNVGSRSGSWRGELGPSADPCLHKPRGWPQCLAQPRPQSVAFSHPSLGAFLNKFSGYKVGLLLRWPTSLRLSLLLI